MSCDEEGGTCTAQGRSLSPEDRALGKPLRINEIEVTVGEPGRHEVRLGELVLPNGIHTTTFFRIANADSKSFRVAQTRVEFQSLEPGAPPFSGFAAMRPAFDGPERVLALLVWTTDWAEKDAVMTIVDLSVE
jgi:hypothetical protein